jgi:hypothetical protein
LHQVLTNGRHIKRKKAIKIGKHIPFLIDFFPMGNMHTCEEKIDAIMKNWK